MGRELLLSCEWNILIWFVRVVQNLKYWKFILASTFSWSFGKWNFRKWKKYFLEAHLDMSVCHQSFYEFFILFSCCQTNRANYILPVFCFEQNGCRGLQFEVHLDISDYFILSKFISFFSCCQTNRANYVLPVFCFEQNGCRGLQWLGPAACAPLTISSVGQKLMQLSQLPKWCKSNARFLFLHHFSF